ncbi:MAG: AAA family ATPase [Anaerolineaceae bacterium 4572_32.2]|nr:MAG: AAA family ATPase [Anaerolineaceae bacterium 4572_32.2]HEY71764.1 AAA family ATPase [Thermoflexia bacterium]
MALMKKENQENGTSNYHNHITDDLDTLLSVLPDDIRSAVKQIGRRDELLEVILDLGRVPTARYTGGEVVLREMEVAREEVQYVVGRVGEFDADNRAGIARTLHRIAAIRNRQSDVVGITCRVGRAVYGTIAIIQDIIEGGKSVLLLGRPGVGKTTMLREAARVLAEKKRVIVVDTSNEIGGDGDIPHPAVGRARRMQVKTPSLQHEVMIEAVENHNPEVIIIDEIGRELEAMAARTIAERGVQLIATAHGNALDNLLLNPTLSDLLGGIESVTLSDEEARRRGTQKTILERRAPPTFDVLIEIQDRQRLLIHYSVAESVDGLLRGQPSRAELRYRDPGGEIHKEQTTPPSLEQRESGRPVAALPVSPVRTMQETLEPVRVFPYGIARNRLESAARRMHVPVYLVKDLGQTEVLVTSKRFYRKRPRLIADAEQRGLPIYVLRANTVAQMEACLSDIFDNEGRSSDDPLRQALQEAEDAIQKVQSGVLAVTLSSQNSYVRRRQHELARESDLASASRGKEPHRRVRIYREE